MISILVHKEIGYTSRIMTQKLIFSSNYRITYDLFRLGAFDYEIYVSDKLRDEMITQSLSGIDF